MIYLKMPPPYAAYVERDRPFLRVTLLRRHGPQDYYSVRCNLTYNEVLRAKCSVLHETVRNLRQGIDDVFGGPVH